MKKTVFTLILSVCSFVIFAQQTINLNAENDGMNISSNSGLKFNAEFSLSELTLQQVVTPKGVFADLSAPGFAYRFHDGHPQIPVFSSLIEMPGQVPIVIRIKGYTVQTIQLSDYGVYDKIVPAQPSYSKDTDPDDIEFVFNEAAYLVNDFTSGSLISVEYQGESRGVGIGQLIVDPIKYNPVTNQLQIFNSIEFEIEFQNENYSQYIQEKDRVYSPYFASYYNKLPNYLPSSTKDVITQYPVKYVIVAAPIFEDSLQKFVNWKTQKGFTVVEAYTNDPGVGTTTTSIKAYLQGLYTAGTPADPAPTFVLLVGDIGEIPPFAGTAGTHPSDMYYGEYTGGSDFIPELYIGRFSATSVAELMPQINKTLIYEKFTMPSSTYMDTCVLVAGYDSGGADAMYGNPTINYATNNYFNTAHGFYSWTYLDPNNTEAIAGASMRSKLYIGMGFANYTAHCDWNMWGTPSFTTTNVASMYNYGKFGLMIGNCCLSNKFNATGGPCLGEALLRADNKGAVGYIGGSNNTLWSEDYWWGIGVTSSILSNPTYATTGLGAYDCVFHDHSEPYASWFVTNSQVLYAGNSAVQASTSTYKKYYWEIYHLMGDPSVMNYMTQPVPLAMTYSAPITVGETSLTVNCEPYTLVAISQNNVLLDAQFSGSGSSVVLNFPAFTSAGTALIVGTKQDRSPHIQNIIIEDVSVSVDAQTLEIQQIQSTYNCVNINVAPLVIIKNKGINNLTQVTVNYKWDAGAAQQVNWNGNLVTNDTAHVQLPQHLVTAGAHTLLVYTSSPNGTSDGNHANDTIEFSINAQDLTISSDFAADVTEFCATPATVHFTNNSANTTSWLWDFGDGTTSTTEDPTHEYAAYGSYSVTLTATAGVCGSDVQTYSDMILVGAAAPVSSDEERCGTGTLTLNASGSGNIVWYSDASGTTQVGTGTSFTTPSLSTTTPYWLGTTISGLMYGGLANNTIITEGGYYASTADHGLVFNCTAPTVLKSVKVYCSSAGTKTIVLMNGATTVQTWTPTVPSGESRITFNYTLPVATGLKLLVTTNAPNLYRNGADAVSMGYPFAVGSNITITGGTAAGYEGNYYYYFYDWEVEEACESALSEVTAYVLNAPVAGFSSVPSGLTVDFTFTGSGDNVTYNWDFGDGQSSTDQNPSHTYATGALYTVVLTVTNSCGSDNETINVDLTTVQIEESAADVEIFPNPAQSYCVIEMQDQMNSIELFDVQGKQIVAFDVKSNSFKLDVSTYAKGVYLLKISTKDRVLVKQIMIE